MPFLTWLADMPRAAGLKVAEQPGWKTRGHGPMGTVRGILLHHTAGPLGSNMPSLGVVTNGRKDLAGPLCNYGLGRDGTVYVVAAGRAYHAGGGSWHGVTAGNTEMIGVEAENNGIGEPWSEVQIEAYVRLCAAVLSHVGADPIMAAGHKEYAIPKGRKIDPTFDMVAFRARVAAAMNGAAPRPPIPKKDSQKRPTLRRGDKGDDVKAMQSAIGVKPVDGKFGSDTESALRSYQRTHKLPVADGICGPATWATIDAVKAAA